MEKHYNANDVKVTILAKSGMNIMKVSVIIPSLNPDNKLVAVVDALLEEGFKDIIIVNDGSDEEHMAPFNEVAAHSECTILTHEVNKGKGRGLKTAFEFCLENRKDIDGVVTVDGDNQYRKCRFRRKGFYW